MEPYDTLNKLNISYREIVHEPVFTVAQAQSVRTEIDGCGCKNLFLCDKLHEHFFLLILDADKRADLKSLAPLLGVSKLTFADENELFAILQLKRGAVSPLGLVNDKEKRVTVVLDNTLTDKQLFVHPLVNNKSLLLSCADLIRIIQSLGNKLIFL